MQLFKLYEALIAPLRLLDVTKLFISLVKPHKPVKSAAIGQWFHEILRLVGTGVSIFSGHSSPRCIELLVAVLLLMIS